jgi:Flp pilus assembly pilin Flp
MAPFVRDERGAIAIQFALILPIFIVILIGAFELWKVLYVQQVLNDAAYQGVKLMVMQGRADYDKPGQPEDGSAVEDGAQQMIRRYMSRCPFVDPALRNDPNSDVLSVSVQYSPSDYPRCGNMAAVNVTLRWTVGREWAGRPSGGWLDFIGLSGDLTGYATGIVLCEREEDVLGVSP